MLRVASSESAEVGSIADVGPIAGRTRDDRLRLARRLDWRFLLPSPVLGQVALGGTPDQALGDALSAATGGQPLVLPASPALATGGPVDQFDTVVLSGRLTRSELIAGAASVADGGHLVVEIDGPLSPVLARRRGAAPGTAARLARTLAAGGFDVRRWWAWPAIGRATAFVSLDDPVAVRALIARRFAGDLGANVATTVGRLAGRAVLAELAPAVILVARRGTAVAGLVERRIGHGVGSPSAGPGGLLILAPRYRASAHVVGLGLRPDGTVERVAKAARLRDDTSLAHEATVLGALGRAGEASRSGPALLDAPGLATAVGEDPWPILVETGLDGDPIDPAAVRVDRARAVAGIEEWLAGLPVGDPATRVIDVGSRLGSALAAVDRLADGSPAGRRLGALVERARPLLASLADVPLPRVFEHGDPAHPNLLRLADGRVGAVDWERGEPDGMLLHDLTVALAYVAAAASKATSAPAQADAFRAAMSGADPWAAAALDRAVDRSGCDPGLRAPLVVAAWVRTAGWLAQHLTEPGGTTTDGVDEAKPLAPELAEWLAADRSVALWAVALDLAGVP